MSILIAFVSLLNLCACTNIWIKYVSDDGISDQSSLCQFEIITGDGIKFEETQYLNESPDDQGKQYVLGNTGDNLMVQFVDDGINCADGNLLISEYEHNGNHSKDMYCPYHHCGESQSSDSDDNFSCGDDGYEYYNHKGHCEPCGVLYWSKYSAVKVCSCAVFNMETVADGCLCDDKTHIAVVDEC